MNSITRRWEYRHHGRSFERTDEQTIKTTIVRIGYTGSSVGRIQALFAERSGRKQPASRMRNDVVIAATINLVEQGSKLEQSIMYTLPAALFIWTLLHIGFVNGDPQADTSALFAWNSVPEMYTCLSATVTWGYGSPAGVDDTQMDISITNFGVAQAPAPPSTTTATFTTHDFRGLVAGRYVSTRTRRADVTVQISGLIPASDRLFTWPSVNVTAGWYVLVATFPATGAVRESSEFFELDLRQQAPRHPAGTRPLPLVSILPVDGASSSKVNRGAIAGGVIGGLAVIAAAIAAFFYLRYASASSGGKKKRTRKWAGLSSTDSKARGYPSSSGSRSAGVSNGRHHSQSESIGPMLSEAGHDNNVYVIGNVGIDSRPSRTNAGLDEEEDDGVNSYFSPSQEKFSHGSPIRSPFSDSGHDDGVPLDLITPLPGAANVTRNSSTSTASYMTHNSRNNFSRPRSHPTSPYASPTATESPFHSTQNDSTNESYPPSPSNPSPAFPSGTSVDAHSHSPTPIVPAPLAPRRGSTGEALGRRVARKAVPQYNINDPSLVSQGSAAAIPESDSSSSLEGPHEGKPVHYLIPDMPPPQRD
ncbi:hypothetical protein C8F01DRAFT_1089290 [Mycena amicta]|nr:hypothetical protein C8F01DRAFT_1089290 [Mycena amicta]